MSEHPKNPTNVSRRVFVIGTVAAPVIAKAGGISLAEPAQAIGQVIPTKITLFNFWDSNMAFQSWSWDFVLEKAQDSSFTLSASQFLEDREEGDDPWELGPVRSLRNGGDIYQALQGMLDEIEYPVDDEELEGVSRLLGEIEPGLAEDFHREIAELSLEEFDK